MIAYIVRRLLILPLVLFGVTVFIFGIFSLLDPVMRASLYVRDVPKTADALQRIIHKYGLDDPIHIQYWRWINQVVRGNFGWSKTAQRPVLQAIGYYLPASLELALWAMVPVILGGLSWESSPLFTTTDPWITPLGCSRSSGGRSRLTCTDFSSSWCSTPRCAGSPRSDLGLGVPGGHRGDVPAVHGDVHLGRDPQLAAGRIRRCPAPPRHARPHLVLHPVGASSPGDPVLNARDPPPGVRDDRSSQGA